MNLLQAQKLARVASRKADAAIGRLRPIGPVLAAMAARPYELHLELTNLCNANCIFCPYQFQTRPIETMADDVFEKAVSDFSREGGGSVFLTPIVGDPLIDRNVLKRVKFLRSISNIDRIQLITKAIMVDRYGAANIINSGLTQITISIAGFDKEMYQRIYRFKQYDRVRRNVLDLLSANQAAGRPVNIVIGLRPDRPLDEVMSHPDFSAVLAYRPDLDFTWSFTSAGGRITREMLPRSMRMRSVPVKRDACVQTYNGPIVLPSGIVLACSCVAAIDAIEDLEIGHVMERELGEIWRSERMLQLRASFESCALNNTCTGCDMYRDLELYRRQEGRERARISRARAAGQNVRRAKETGAFSGG